MGDLTKFNQIGQNNRVIPCSKGAKAVLGIGSQFIDTQGLKSKLCLTVPAVISQQYSYSASGIQYCLVNMGTAGRAHIYSQLPLSVDTYRILGKYARQEAPGGSDTTLFVKNSNPDSSGNLPDLSGDLQLTVSSDALPQGGVVSSIPRASIMTKIAPVLQRTSGVLGVLSGIWQGCEGAQELTAGNKLDGGTDSLSGSLNIAGGAALLFGGASAAPFLFGPSSVIDGGRDLYRGIQDKDWRKTASGGVKIAGGGMMVAGGVLMATGVGVPVGIALVIGGGVLSAGASIYEGFHESIDNGVKSFFSGVKNVATHFLGCLSSTNAPAVTGSA